MGNSNSNPGADNEPLVSVIIPTHNRAEQGYLERAIKSVLDQSYQHFEIVVINDASTDSTVAYLESLTDERIRALSHDVARGGCAARNTGVSAAKGKFVAFLDDDDIWIREKLALQVKALNESGAPFGYGGWRWLEQTTGEVMSERIPDDSGLIDGHPKWFYNTINDVIIETELARLNPFNEDVQLMYPNSDLLIRLTKNGPPTWVSSNVSDCFRHSGPRTSDSAAALADGIEYLLRTHRDFFDDYPREKANYLIRLGVHHMGHSGKLSGIKYFGRAFWSSPREVRIFKHLAAATARMALHPIRKKR